MFPTPIARTRPSVRAIYRFGLPVSLLIWLIPLLAVMLTSIRSAGDIAAGNYWGWPQGIYLVENYMAVFQNSPIAMFILNSFKVTIPTVIGAVALSCLTGFALGVYRFKGNLLVFFMFVAGNFVPFQILMVPVRDLTLNMGMYDTVTGLVLFPYRLPNRVLYAVHAELHPRVTEGVDRGRTGRGRQRTQNLLVHRAAIDASGYRGVGRPDLHLHLE